MYSSSFRRCYITCDEMGNSKAVRNAINRTFSAMGGVFWNNVMDKQFYQIITYIRVPMRCARTAVGQCTDRSPWVRSCGEELFNLCVFDRFCHGKFICLFILFLLLRGRVPLILFRLYGLNFSVVVTSHCAQPNKRLQDVSWVVFSFGITCFIPIYGLDFRIFHGLLFV